MVAGVTVHLLYAAVGIMPTARPSFVEQVRFQIDYTFWLNIVFSVIGAVLLLLHWQNPERS